MSTTKTLHLVWNAAMSECVGFLDKGDADYTATGKRKHLKAPALTPTIGDEFRGCYGEDAKRLPQTVVNIPAA